MKLTEPMAQRMADVFTRKALRSPPTGYGLGWAADEEWLRGMILTVVTDTDLVLTGAVQIEDFDR